MGPGELKSSSGESKQKFSSTVDFVLTDRSGNLMAGAGSVQSWSRQTSGARGSTHSVMLSLISDTFCDPAGVRWKATGDRPWGEGVSILNMLPVVTDGDWVRLKQNRWQINFLFLPHRDRLYSQHQQWWETPGSLRCKGSKCSPIQENFSGDRWKECLQFSQI